MDDDVPGLRTGTRSAATAGQVTAYWDGGSSTRLVDSAPTLLIGRDPACDFVIDHPSVSRKHATLHFAERGGPFLEDLSSRNGSRVGGRLLEAGERRRVAPGAIMEIGDAVVVLRQGDEEDIPPSSVSFGGPPSVNPAATTAMDRVNRLIRLVAGSGISVILLGETGVGKEVFARRIHETSSRASSPFVALNCGALPEALLESELFGHEKGAFTGATGSRVGLLESAHRGTVFLDELGEMPAATQVKLLRAIELREILPVGASRPRAIDVRFIAATHRDLETLVEEGTFRSDLFFRLNGITIDLPPLRERKDEVAPLAKTFAGATTITEAAIRELEGYDWPGNIRELRNVVERGVLLAEGHPVDRDHIMLRRPGSKGRVSASMPPVPMAAAPSSATHEEAAERQRIVDALAQCAGNQTKAAEVLGLTRRALIYRMDQYKIDGPRRNR